jgi:hypothetical protein
MSNGLLTQLKTLKLHGMAQALPDLLALEKHSCNPPNFNNT